LIVFGERAMNGVTMTTTERTATRSKRQTIDNTQELRDALFHAICFLDHANPENDTDHRDVAAARELAKLRESLNREAHKEPWPPSADWRAEARKPLKLRHQNPQLLRPVC
jgi:hypothetical protein